MRVLPENLVQFLYSALATRADETLVVEPRGNLIRRFTLKEVAQMVTLFARGMSATDFKQGNRVAVVCNSSLSSLVACFANMLNGCINVIIPKSAGPELVHKAIADARCQALVIDDAALTQHILSEIHLLPELRQIILLDRNPLPRKPEILCASWDDIMERAQGQPERLPQQLRTIDPEQQAFLFYLRDADDELSAYKQSHKDIIACLPEVMEGLARQGCRAEQAGHCLSVIPLNHPHGWAAGIMLPLFSQQQMMLLDASESWKSGTLPFKPGMLVADKQAAEQAAEQIRQAVGHSNPLFARLLARRIAMVEQGGGSPQHPLSRLLGRLLAGHLRQQLGGAVRAFICTDKSVSTSTRALFTALGVVFFTFAECPGDKLESKF